MKCKMILGHLVQSLPLGGAVTCGVVMVGFLMAPAHAADADRAAQRHQARVERLWRAQWRAYAEPFFMYDGQAYPARNYQPRKPSSAPITEAQLKRPKLRLTWKQWGGGSYVQKGKNITPPSEDIQVALRVLPRLAPGHYGTVQSVLIDEILPDGSVWVTELKYLDPLALQDARHRAWETVGRQISGYVAMNHSDQEIIDFLFQYRNMVDQLPSEMILMTGFDRPEDLEPGDRWTGPFDVVLIDRGRGLEAVPRKDIKLGLTEAEFAAMLEARGKSKLLLGTLIAQALDRRLSTRDRTQVVRRWIDDYTPAPPDPEVMAAGDPAGGDSGATGGAVSGAASGGASEGGGGGEDPASPPTDPEAIRRQLDGYLDDAWDPDEPDASGADVVGDGENIEEGEEPDPTQSIFDFARD